MRMAFSFASAPPLVKKTLREARRGARRRCAWRPRRARGSRCAGAIVVSSVGLLLDRRRRRAGCWWPMLTLTSWLEKSRYSRPAWSQTRQPSPPAMTSGGERGLRRPRVEDVGRGRARARVVEVLGGRSWLRAFLRGRGAVRMPRGRPGCAGPAACGPTCRPR